MRIDTIIITSIFLFFVAACSDSGNENAQRYSHSSVRDQESHSGNISNKFLGYRCTDDCSGHEAGYEWAEENEVTDPDDCDGNSESFIEGCRAYGEEMERAEADEQAERDAVLEDSYYDGRGDRY